MLPHTKANLEKLRTFAEERLELVNKIRYERNRLDDLEALRRRQLADPSADPDTIAELTKEIHSLETHINRLDRDIDFCHQNQEIYLRELFGNYKSIPRSHESTDIYFGGYNPATNDRFVHGDGLGHGHALLYCDGHIIIFREPLDPSKPLDDAISNYRHAQRLLIRNRGKKSRPAKAKR